MNENKVEIAIQEAERFLLRVSAWKIANKRTYEMDGKIYPCYAPAESAALKRASLDLTRALADMRKSR